MRPDAHKQKTSAKYKKKHGLAESKKSEEQENAKKKGSKSAGRNVAGSGPGPAGAGLGPGTEKKATSAGPAVAGGAAGSGGSQRTELNQAGLGGTDGAAPSVEEQIFRRRKLVNNWDRYEGLDVTNDDEDAITHRGADFAALLNVTSTALSQFRFADEREWDLTGTDSAYDGSSTLNIDCVDLAAALQCVPLHRRLNLDEKIFTADQVDRFNSVAECNHRSYEPKPKTTSSDAWENAPASLMMDADFGEDLLESPSTISTETECFACSPTEAVAGNASLSMTSAPSNGSGGHHSIIPNEGVTSLKALSNPVKEPLRSSHSGLCDLGITNIKQSHDMPNTKTESLPRTLQKSETSVMPQPCQKSLQEDLTKEDELDFLLSLDAPVISAADVQQTVSESPSSSLSSLTQSKEPGLLCDTADVQSGANSSTIPQSSTTNLEDWLDTMVDD